MKKWWKDPQRRLEVGKKISASQRARFCDKHKDLRTYIRESHAYRVWKKNILRRDEYTCQSCGYKVHHRKKNKGLDVHHIKPFAQILKENNILTNEDREKALQIEELFDTNNGMTLWIECHSAKHGRKIR